MAIADGMQPISGLVTVNLFSESEGRASEAIELELSLLIDVSNGRVSGFAQVTQATSMPILCISHVSGVVIHRNQADQESKVRLDLVGYPAISWPNAKGIPDAFSRNFNASVVLDEEFTSGEVVYHYKTSSGALMEERQKMYQEAVVEHSFPMAA